jgi:hypothetical protein
MLNLNTNWPSVLIKKINQWWPVVKSNFEAIQSVINGHITGTTYNHSASSITNDSAEMGSNVKEVIENNRIELNAHYTGTANKHLANSIINNSNEEGGTVEEALNTNKARFDNHITGVSGQHASDSISYSGSFVGKDTVKAALDQAKSEIDTIATNASIDPEVALARNSAVKSKTFTTLDGRLEESEQDIIGLVNNMSNYETIAGAQAKVDGALNESKTYTDQKTGEVQTALESTNNTLNTHLSDNMYQTAGGTATAITVVIGEALSDGLPVNFKCSASNSGAATTINTKQFYKPGTTTAPNLVSGKYYTAIWNVSGNCFFIKASAEGNASVGDVLAGRSFSNDSDTGLIGTLIIPEHSSQTYAIAGTYNFTVPAGVTQVFAIIVGGGGGAGYVGGSPPGGGAGGGGGTYIDTIAVTPGEVLSAVVGAGGAGGSYYVNGSTGGSSSFSGRIANGGQGGSMNGGYGGGAGGAGGGMGCNGGNGGIGTPGGTGLLNAGIGGSGAYTGTQPGPSGSAGKIIIMW